MTHNLKVTGSNPVPATTKSGVISYLQSAPRGAFCVAKSPGSTAEAKGCVKLRGWARWQRRRSEFVPIISWDQCPPSFGTRIGGLAQLLAKMIAVSFTKGMLFQRPTTGNPLMANTLFLKCLASVTSMPNHAWGTNSAAASTEVNSTSTIVSGARLPEKISSSKTR